MSYYIEGVTQEQVDRARDHYDKMKELADNYDGMSKTRDRRQMRALYNLDRLEFSLKTGKGDA
jgi:hypothetical protein